MNDDSITRPSIHKLYVQLAKDMLTYEPGMSSVLILEYLMAAYRLGRESALSDKPEIKDIDNNNKGNH